MRPVETESKRKFVIHFKADRPQKVCICGRTQAMSVVSLGKTIGWADSAEAALARVEHKLNHDPIWAAWWREQFGDGRFYAVLIDTYVELPKVEAIA